MPYGIDKSIGGDSPENVAEVERCVNALVSKGKDKSTAIAICKAMQKRRKQK